MRSVSAEVVARKDSDTRGGSLSNPFLLIRTREFVTGTSKCVSFPNIQGKRSQIYTSKRPWLVHIIQQCKPVLSLECFLSRGLERNIEAKPVAHTFEAPFLVLVAVTAAEKCRASVSLYLAISIFPTPSLPSSTSLSTSTSLLSSFLFSNTSHSKTHFL